VTSLLPRHGFLLSNPFSGADGASPSNFWMGKRSAFRNPFRVPLRTGFGILSFDSGRGRGVSPAYSLFLDSKSAMDFCSQTLAPAPTERRPPTFGWGRGLPFGRGVSPAYSHVLDSKGAVDFCSQTLSPAPTERRPPTFVAGAVCLSKPVPGSATNVAGAGSVPRGQPGSVPRIHSFWTRRAPWFFALKPFLRCRRSVALQLLDGDAVCLSKPVPGSATNGIWDPEF
jgi:hypothetical protein